MEPGSSSFWRIVGEAASHIFWGSPAFEAHLTPYAALTLSGEPVADLNFSLIDSGPHPDVQLRTFVHLIKARDLPCLFVLTEGVATALTPVARELGLEHAGILPLMICQAPPLPRTQSPYIVQRVTHERELQAANHMVESAFELPVGSMQRVCGPRLLEAHGTHIFLASQDGSPRSTVWTIPVGAVVGIWCMATSPNHQRQGAGRALLEHAMAYHREHGAHTFYLLATPAGEPLYRQLGFQTVAEPVAWVAGHSSQFP